VRGKHALAPVGGGDRIAEVGDRGALPVEHLDVEVERCLPELAEPEAVLVHDVDREPVAAGRDRRSNRDVEGDAIARLSLDRSAKTVPHDRVAQFVEPVVRDREPIAPPGRVARVLEFDPRGREHAGTELGQLVRAPPHRDRPSHAPLV
jgi:hypothetical protein